MSGASLMMGSKGLGGGPGGALTVSVSPDFLYGFNYGYGTVYTSEAAFCTVTGGVGPFTYEWVRVSGTSSVVPQQQGNDATRFQSSSIAPSSEGTAVYKCTVTPSVGSPVDSNTITVTLEKFGNPSGGDVP